MMSFHVTAQNTREKTLVVFFSQTGNTRSVGKAIQELAGGDLFELNTIAQPIATFLGKFDFKGKTIIPFCTHGGGGAGHSSSDIAKRVHSAKLLEGYAFSGSKTDKKAIETWLRKLKIKK